MWSLVPAGCRLTSTRHSSPVVRVVRVVRVKHLRNSFTSPALLSSQEIVHGQFEINLQIVFRKYSDIDVKPNNHSFSHNSIRVLDEIEILFSKRNPLDILQNSTIEREIYT